MLICSLIVCVFLIQLCFQSPLILLVLLCVLSLRLLWWVAGCCVEFSEKDEKAYELTSIVSPKYADVTASWTENARFW